MLTCSLGGDFSSGLDAVSSTGDKETEETNSDLIFVGGGGCHFFKILIYKQVNT